ncbi:MAG: hypothetical protein JW704_08405 [Anaerolineaceae bacterium]|nr:hypothetical protein [Anaerolineaceae bacterium]
MDDNSLFRLSLLFSEMALVLGAVAEMEAMKAENQLREFRGYTQAYGEEAFMRVSDRLAGYASTLNGIFR